MLSKLNVCVCISCSVVSDSVTPWTVSPPGSFVHGILQARILEWGAFPFSRGSSQHRVPTQISCITGRFFIIWAMYRKISKFTYRGTWNKPRVIPQNICWPHTGHEKAGLVQLNLLRNHMNIVHMQESLFMVVNCLWCWISPVYACQKLVSSVITIDSRKQKSD